MAMMEATCAIAGNEAKATLYTQLPDETVLAFTHFNQVMNDVQGDNPSYVPAPNTYFKYSAGFIKSGLGESAAQGRIKNGFLKYSNREAEALAVDLLIFSANRPRYGLSDFIEPNRTEYFPRSEAMRILLEEPDGLCFADLTERVYGDREHRYRTSNDVFVHQLTKRGLMQLEHRNSGMARGPKTSIRLSDDGLGVCKDFIGILDKHNNPSDQVIDESRENANLIFSDTDLVRSLVAKSFKKSAWAHSTV